MTGKKKIQSSVWRVRDDYYDRKKKDTVVCLLGARFWQLRPEKKRMPIPFLYLNIQFVLVQLELKLIQIR